MEQRKALAAWAAAQAVPGMDGIFAAIGSAAGHIAEKIRLGELNGAYGAAGATNVQGEQQQKLDVFANDVLTKALGACASVAAVVSEEDDAPVVFQHDGEGARFVVSFDPLDGSSNIDVNVNVGTIFGVRRAIAEESAASSVLRPGTEQVAAGYVVYGPSVVLVATVAGGPVSAFTLTAGGGFVESASGLEMPEAGPYYSANEANQSSWPRAYRAFLAELVEGSSGASAHSARYIGSLVADFHRTLLKGGVFLYPPTQKALQGKLRLQYEANPLAMIAEAAGGRAVNGVDRILEVQATGIHQRTPLVIGSRREVERLQELVREGDGQ